MKILLVLLVSVSAFAAKPGSKDIRFSKMYTIKNDSDVSYAAGVEVSDKGKVVCSFVKECKPHSKCKCLQLGKKKELK